MTDRVYIAASDARKRLAARLAALEGQHQQMKEANKAARKAGADLPNGPAAMRDVWCRMRNVHAQLAKLEALEKIKSSSFAVPGATIEIRRAESRVRFKFERVPSARVSIALRRAGFLWSAEHRAWQRRLSQEAIEKANEIAEIVRAEASP